MESRFFVVLGLDTEKKPHAARFTVADETIVQKVAAAKGFSIGVAKTKAAADIAGRLIEGKLFDSGRGLVPFVTKETYDKLTKVLDITGPAGSGATTLQSSTKAADADPWQAVRVGSIVLCRDTEPGPDCSWWECVVTDVSKDTKALTVRWKNFPTLKPFRVKRTAIALLPR